MRPSTGSKRIGHSGRGQALVELAVFGAIFLMVLGALVSYGLRYSFDLQVKQQAYRRALRIASDPNIGSGSYVLMVDKQIPDLTDPYGIGSSVPFVVSSSVTRSYQTDAVFDREAPSRGDLPTTVMDVQGNADNSGTPAVINRHVYTTAAVRRERKASGAKYTDWEVTKYQFIYGDARRSEDELEMTIVDNCSGEVVDHSSCWDQARRLVDGSYCLRLCNHTYSPADEDSPSCPDLCAQRLNPPNEVDHSYNAAAGGPWYAANWRMEDGAHVFPVLDDLFSYAGDGARSMGIQQDQTSTAVKDTTLRKIETSQESAEAAGTITTVQDLAWDEATNKTYVWHNNVDAVGYEIPHAELTTVPDRIVQEPFRSTYTGRSSETWRTPK